MLRPIRVLTCLFFVKRKVLYDEKRILYVYYNITPILSWNYFTSKIAKASDFTTK